LHHEAATIANASSNLGSIGPVEAGQIGVDVEPTLHESQFLDWRQVALIGPLLDLMTLEATEHDRSPSHICDKAANDVKGATVVTDQRRHYLLASRSSLGPLVGRNQVERLHNGAHRRGGRRSPRQPTMP
jgi:hypothetical protein